MWAGWTSEGFSWRKWQWQLVKVTVGHVSAGGKLTTSGHPSAHGSSGLSHQLPKDHLLHHRLLAEGACHQVPALSLILCSSVASETLWPLVWAVHATLLFSSWPLQQVPRTRLPSVCVRVGCGVEVVSSQCERDPKAAHTDELGADWRAVWEVRDGLP